MKNFAFLFAILVFASCKVQQKTYAYSSEDLIINEVGNGVFMHISNLQTESFGNVACNGMVVISGGEALVFDTPTNSSATYELINWLKSNQKVTIKGVVITHFHEDCLGGISVFHDNGIPSYANNRTISLCKANNLIVPDRGFDDSLELMVGNQAVINSFFGEGHTKDNIVCYYPARKALFGGCLVKTDGATKGYLGEANENEWSNTVKKIKSSYPDVKVVIPGHGQSGGINLLDYTINLFKSGKTP